VQLLGKERGQFSEEDTSCPLINLQLKLLTGVSFITNLIYILVLG